MGRSWLFVMEPWGSGRRWKKSIPRHVSSTGKYPHQKFHRKLTFGTIRCRNRHSKGCLSRDGMLHMMFKLGQCAEKKWRQLHGFDYLTKVIAGVKFKGGVEVSDVDLAAA